MIIYDIDKIIREPLRVHHRGKMYEVIEPTVKTWADIKKDLDEELKKGEIEGYKFLIGKMIPELLNRPLEKKKTFKDKILRREVKSDSSTILDKAMKSELKIIGDICIKVLSGGGATGKMKAPEDIMEKR